MIAITAATGAYGSLVVQKLLERGVSASDITVAVRDPQKADVFATQGITIRHADYDNPASLETAFAGADRLLFISSPEYDLSKRVAQHERVIAAAKQATAGQVVYTSFLGAGSELVGGLNAHYLTERALEQSGLPFTFLRNAFYTDGVLPPETLRAAIASGELKSATGGQGMNTATRTELAEAAAVVLTSSDAIGVAYSLTGSLWTFAQAADALTRISSRPISNKEVSPQELGAAGFLHALFRSGTYEQTTPDLEHLLGRDPATIEEYIATVLPPEVS